MKTSIILFLCLLTGCATRNPVEEAKAVVRSHEEFSKAGNLDGVMSNMADDVVLLAPGVPLIKGKEACRNFYAAALAMGRGEFTHDYHGAEVAGDLVVLYGFAHGTMTRPDSTSVPLANNFILMLKYQPDGKLKMWRGAFAPASQQGPS
jgi:ketosteroid isomerase-like protein